MTTDDGETDAVPPVSATCRFRIIFGIASTDVIAGIGLGAWGWEDSQNLLILAVGLAVLGSLALFALWMWSLVCHRYMAIDELWDDAEQIGYSRGFDAGQRSARPSIVRKHLRRI